MPEATVPSSLTPSISVIPTRDRGDRLLPAIRSIQDNDYPDFRLVIVDQSQCDTTLHALQPLLSSKRVQYVRSTKTGVSAARNLGAQIADSPILAVTDDDCIVPEDWLRSIAKAFCVDPNVGVVFGNVLPAEFDSRKGFIPVYVRGAPMLARSIRQKLQVEGGSACMAVRRDVWARLDGFDEMLGVGAPLRSGAETDFTIRALNNRVLVYETPDLHVVHDGFRSFHEGRALMRRYWYGTGAVFAKHFRLHPVATFRLLLLMACRWLFGRSAMAKSMGRRSHRVLRLFAFIGGFLRGYWIPTDQAGHFCEEERDT